MSSLSCCFWWFLLGLIAGWLLNWLLQRWTRKDDSGSGTGSASHSTYSSAAKTTAPNTLMGASVAAAAAAGFKIKGNDDLEIIEGIGPKIAELFRDNGVSTFDKVMNMSVSEMQAILEKGGPRFKLANPGTWAEQARLCHENRWTELRALQDHLTAGVDKSGDGYNA